jgi:hypothetical protein
MQSRQNGLIDELIEKSQTALSFAVKGDFANSRKLLDEVRFVRDLFVRDESSLQSLSASQNSQSDVDTRIAVLNQSFDALQKWLDSLRSSEDKKEMLKSPDGVGIYLDCHLPLIWNWEEDLIVIDDTLPATVETALVDRGQAHILVLREGVNTHGIKFVTSTGSAYETLSDWSTHAIGRSIVLSADSLSEQARPLLDEISQIFKGFRIGQNTKAHFSRAWALQQIKNLSSVLTSHPVTALKPFFQGRSCIIVSPGPSLATNIDLLANKRDDHIILAVAQAVPALAKHGIDADYIMVLDPGDHSQTLANAPLEKVKGLIIGDACHPAFFVKGFRNLYTFFSVKPSFGIDDIMSSTSPTVPGGSVSVAAATLAISFGARYVTLVGSDLAVSGGLYYQHTPTAEQLAKPMSEISVPGYYGDRVASQANYASFLQEFQRLAANADEETMLINATEGGAYIDGFVHMPLAEALLKRGSGQQRMADETIPIEALKSRSKRLAGVLVQERGLLATALGIANDCTKLAKKLKSGTDPKAKSLRKKESKLAQLTSQSTSLQIFCQDEISSILRQIKLIRSFEENIALSLKMYAVIQGAIELIRPELSDQIKQLENLT